MHTRQSHPGAHAPGSPGPEPKRPVVVDLTTAPQQDNRYNLTKLQTQSSLKKQNSRPCVIQARARNGTVVATSWCLINRDNGRRVVDSLAIADGFFSRLIGAIARLRWLPGNGLLIVPCQGVHTWLMRYAIDVVMLDRQGRVLMVHRHVRPWNVIPATQGTYAVLEMPAGSAEINMGATLRLRAACNDRREPPPSAMFLWSLN